jgi:hypothetical protein
MKDLLAFAVEAHGGLANWDAFSRLRAEVSVGGAIWQVKQQPDLLKSNVFEIDTHAERLSITPFATPRHRSVFVPDRLTLETLDGNVCEMRNDPDTAFEGHVRETPWDKFHVAYFASEALWTYLTSPFLYTYPGFVSEEIEPRQEKGEIWRRLRVPSLTTSRATRGRRSHILVLTD